MAVEILGVYAEASGGQTPPVAAVPVLAFDAARLRLLEPSGALFYDYVYEALLWDQTYGVPDSVIEAFLAGMAAEMEALAARVQEAAGSRETSRTASMILRTASWDDSPQGPPPSENDAGEMAGHRIRGDQPLPLGGCRAGSAHGRGHQGHGRGAGGAQWGWGRRGRG